MLKYLMLINAALQRLVAQIHDNLDDEQFLPNVKLVTCGLWSYLFFFMLCKGIEYNVILDLDSYVCILYWNINVDDNLSDAY